MPLILNLAIREGTFLKTANTLLFLKTLQTRYQLRMMLRSILENLRSKFALNAEFETLYQVIKMVLFYAHYVGCCWYMVGRADAYDSNWMSWHDLEGKPWYVLYLYSVYWAVETMSTIGYGDIAPRNPIEVVFTIITMLVSSMVFAYSLSIIGNTINAITLTSRRISTDMSIINGYMHRKHLEPGLQCRIRHYLQNLWIEDSKYRYGDEARILNTLSPNLQSEIQANLYGKLISSVPVLFRYFSR